MTSVCVTELPPDRRRLAALRKGQFTRTDEQRLIEHVEVLRPGPVELGQRRKGQEQEQQDFMQGRLFSQDSTPRARNPG